MTGHRLAASVISGRHLPGSGQRREETDARPRDCLARGGWSRHSASSIAPADELPRTGKVKLQISQLQYSSEDLRLDHDTGFGSVEFAGVTRNVDGKSWFDRMTQRCTGQYYVAETGAPPPNGACLYTNIYGDCMVVAYRGTAQRAGVQRIIGGTGRYAGIFGQGTYTATKLRSPTVGLEFWLTDVELEYELDRSSP